MSESKPPKLTVQPVATITTTVVNIICNVIGGALLVLPQAMDDLSVIPGIIVFLLFGFLGAVSVMMMIIPGEMHQKFTYRELITQALGRRMGVMFDLVLVLFTFGILIEFAKILAQAMPPTCNDIAGKRGVWSHEYLWLLIAFPFFWGFSSMKQLSHLKWTSYLGIATIYYVVAFILVRFFLGTYSDTPGSLVSQNVDFARLDIGFVTGFPILSTTYSVQYNIPYLYGELHKRSIPRFGKAVAIAMSIVTATYLTCALFGYLMFGGPRVEGVKGNIMLAFSDTDIPGLVGQAGLFIHFCCVFPITALGCRHCFNQLVFGSAYQTQKIYIIEAFFMVGTACVLAFVIPGIRIVVELIGAFFAISIVYVMPGAIYLKLGPGQECDAAEETPQVKSTTLGEEDDRLINARSENGDGDDVNEKKVEISPRQNSLLRGTAWCFVVGGLLGTVLSIVVTIRSIVIHN